MPTVELTRFRTHPGRAADLTAARPEMIQSFRSDRAGFIRADLVRVAEDEWLDIIVWESPEAYAESRRKGANTAAIEAFFALIVDLVSAEEGDLVAMPAQGRQSGDWG